MIRHSAISTLTGLSTVHTSPRVRQTRVVLHIMSTLACGHSQHSQHSLPAISNSAIILHNQSDVNWPHHTPDNTSSGEVTSFSVSPSLSWGERFCELHFRRSSLVVQNRFLSLPLVSVFTPNYYHKSDLRLFSLSLSSVSRLQISWSYIGRGSQNYNSR